jgi:excisionase family DNA binding protein
MAIQTIQRVEGPMNNHNKLAYTVGEATELSPCSRSSLYEAIAAGELKARKLGRRTLIMADDLRSWLESLPTLKPACAAEKAANHN